MQSHPTRPEEGGPVGPPPGATPEARRGLSRRNLLATLGVTAAGGALALASFQEDAQAAMTPAMTAMATKAKASAHAWCMVIDLRTCDGCKGCTMACQQRHGLREEQTWINVYEMKDATGGTFSMPRPCMMCEDAPCMYICPVGANIRTDDGLVLVDTEACIGSRACMAACPYEARYFNWADPLPQKRMPAPSTPQMPVPEKGVVGKCVFCADRLPQGELPACVSGCPMGVLYIGDLVTDIAVNGLGKNVVLSQFLRANDAVRFKEELGTNPRVYYILGHGQSLGGGE
jgi:molybdopterin-containing oxidoreductase family iron-sulfur binding subunit